MVELSDLLEQKGYKIPRFQHAKAHQDKHKSCGELSRDAQLNVQADELATSFQHTDFIRQDYQVPSAVKASLYIKKEAITSKLKECLRHKIHLPELQPYMQKKWDWMDSTVEGIWWSAHGSALKTLSHLDRQIIQKFNYSHLPTNHCLNKLQQPHIEPYCSTCPNVAENDDDHIVWWLQATAETN